MEKDPTILKRLHYDFFWVALHTDGIVRVQIRANEDVEVEHIKKIVDAIKLIGAAAKRPILIVAGEYTLPSPAAREYLATPESDPYASAEAYVITSFSQRLVGNVYLRLNKPARATRLFNSEEKAIEWLRGFL